MTFARSMWQIISNKQFNYNIKKDNPIGISFVNNKVDIYRKIHELYYCYHYKFEKQNQFYEVIWGRKYIIRNLDNYSTVIQEFFSPEIII